LSGISRIKSENPSVAITRITVDSKNRLYGISSVLELREYELTPEDCVIQYASYGLEIEGNATALIPSNRLTTDDVGMSMRGHILSSSEMISLTEFLGRRIVACKSLAYREQDHASGDDGMVVFGAAAAERDVIRGNGDCEVWAELSEYGAHLEAR